MVFLEMWVFLTSDAPLYTSVIFVAEERSGEASKLMRVRGHALIEGLYRVASLIRNRPPPPRTPQGPWTQAYGMFLRGCCFL